VGLGKKGVSKEYTAGKRGKCVLKIVIITTRMAESGFAILGEVFEMWQSFWWPLGFSWVLGVVSGVYGRERGVERESELKNES